MKRKWTTVMRNGVILRPDLIAVEQQEAERQEEARKAAQAALSLRDAEIVSAQLRASAPGSRGNVRRKDGVERLALGRCG